MKEERYFYQPAAEETDLLNREEAEHALRVLRLKEGDEIFLIDGSGNFLRATITEAGKKNCRYTITEKLPQAPLWNGHLHLAVAPTKMNERMEWMAEKATEIGFDELSFLDCRFSERKVIKTERIRRVIIAAVKQSHKARVPVVNELTPFSRFLKEHREGRRFIAHCYDNPELCPNGKPFLFDTLKQIPNTDASNGNITVLIGPEGDFSTDEVKLAIEEGCEPVSLGRSRLRTETAALVAVHLMNLFATGHTL